MGPMAGPRQAGRGERADARGVRGPGAGARAPAAPDRLGGDAPLHVDHAVTPAARRHCAGTRSMWNLSVQTPFADATTYGAACTPNCGPRNAASISLSSISVSKSHAT